MNFWRSDEWASKARYRIMLIMFVACFLWGGGSRVDIRGLIFLQPLAVLCLAGFVLTRGHIRWNVIQVPLALVGALALIMLLQLVPLPPSVWSTLPGQAQLAELIAVGGGELPWRPLSLTPDLTLASLAGLVVPVAALVGFAALRPEQTHRLLPWLLGALALSTVLGLAQLLGGTNNAFYLYAVTNGDSAVGFFSNRNHQAAFLAMGWPMLALWVNGAGARGQQRNARYLVAGVMAVFLVPMVAATGSRAGLFLAVIGLASAWWLQRRAYYQAPGPAEGRLAPAWMLAPLAGGILVLVAAILLSRAEAVDRLFANEVSTDLRAGVFPLLIDIAKDFAPFGSGFGSFDPLFRFYEPDQMLRSTYLNHAHNDLLELFITGGAPALVVAILFLLWWGRRSVVAFRDRSGGLAHRLALFAIVATSILLLSSLADYPLRTPLHAMLFALSCGWLAHFEGPRRAGQRGNGFTSHGFAANAKLTQGRLAR